MEEKMRAVDLFAGCGGLSLGLMNAGMDVVAAYENWESALYLYEKNFAHPVHSMDLADVVPAIDSIRQYAPEIIVGGPPCQDFSSAGKRDEGGGRGDLTFSFAQIVVGVEPEWFVMENVDRIQKAHVFAQAKQSFTEAGYGLTEAILDASICGVPQKRKRMFLIGKKGEKAGFLLTGINASLGQKSLTVREYLGEEVDTQFYYRHARSYARRGVFSIDEPSPTIRGVNRPIPPDYQFHKGDACKNLAEIRPLTSLERARIQTFPRTYDWSGVNKSNLEQIIGNAVPVNLAHFVGARILEHTLVKACSLALVH